ncbi:MAG TPA: hypothetical protein VLY23_03145 [Candidatus Acidoferrum sp.]|nr:hypothetical protein [Candidatus Acidoferrum sp.]
MLLRRDILKTFGLALFAAPAAATLAPSLAAASRRAPDGDVPTDPWTAAQTVSPAAFAKELAAAGEGRKPVIVCAGFHTLFEGAHVPGASYHGPATTAQGLDDLKKFAEPLARDANLVVYCGCCPLVHCPNARPAFTALRDMGFTYLRLLAIPKDFASDWVAAGYPVAKGK